MTEAEWNASTDVQAMLNFLERPAGDRKVQLFAAACLGRLRHLLTDERSRRVAPAVEAYADGLLTREDLEQAWHEADGAVRADVRCPFRQVAADVALLAWLPTVHAYLLHTFAAFACCAAPETLRDAFGPLPFRAVRLDRAWLHWNGGAVARTAHAIYAERAFEHLPILADALEDAGCRDADVLGHLRGPGPHARGCWIVDLILSKDR
jgi:hypothetical protein